MKKEVVRPSYHRHETQFVLTAIIGIIVSAAALISLHQRDENLSPIARSQISVFNDLNQEEQGVYSSLSTAREDIIQIWEDENRWISIDELEAGFIPPFVRDSVWSIQNGITWKLYTENHTDGVPHCAYLGISSDNNIGSFVLLFSQEADVSGHSRPQTGTQVSSIWYTRKPVSEPFGLFSDAALSAAGWQEAVPHTGGNELKRLKGV